MNRIDRLLALVLELRLRGQATAENLAKHFNTSKRTIYRDVQALSEMGVPVVALMGQGYSLGEGYFLPPLAFNEEEATLILLGLGAMMSSFDAEYRRSVESARRKVLAVLSEALRQRAESLQSSLLLGNIQTSPPAELEIQRQIRRAILHAQTVRFRYFSRHPGDGKMSLRYVDPYSLACLDGVWYLSAYCHLRQARRLFRLSRIEALELTVQTFQRPSDYHIRDEAERDDRQTLVQLILAEDVQPWINEDRFYYIERREPHPEGLLVTLRVRHIDEIVQWVLGWGRHVRVLEPIELRQRLIAEAHMLLKTHMPSD